MFFYEYGLLQIESKIYRRMKNCMKDYIENPTLNPIAGILCEYEYMKLVKQDFTLQLPWEILHDKYYVGELCLW